jgi:hypothetical protein
LHLIGFDHDTAPRKRRMGALTRRLVRAAPLDGPPAKRAVKSRDARKAGPSRRKRLKSAQRTRR